VRGNSYRNGEKILRKKQRMGDIGRFGKKKTTSARKESANLKGGVYDPFQESVKAAVGEKGNAA